MMRPAQTTGPVRTTGSVRTIGSAPATRAVPAARPALATAVLTATALAAVLVSSAPTAAAASAPPAAAGRPGNASGSCPAGAFCLWDRHGYGGTRSAHELSGTDIESCIPLPAGASAGSLANRTGRPVTTYQSAECGETGEFDTYPGGGTWVPDSPYRVRAFKIWEN